MRHMLIALVGDQTAYPVAVHGVEVLILHCLVELGVMIFFAGHSHTVVALDGEKEYLLACRFCFTDPIMGAFGFTYWKSSDHIRFENDFLVAQRTCSPAIFRPLDGDVFVVEAEIDGNSFAERISSLCPARDNPFHP